MDTQTLKVITHFARVHGPEHVCRWIGIAIRRFDADADDEVLGRYVSGIRRKEWAGEEADVKTDPATGLRLYRKPVARGMNKKLRSLIERVNPQIEA